MPLRHEPAPSRTGGDLTALSIAPETYPAFAALQYGPTPTNVLYLVLTARAQYGDHDTLQVFIPGHPRYGTPARLRGKDKPDGMEFPEVEVESAFGDARLRGVIRFTSESRWEAECADLSFTAACVVTHGPAAKTARFTVHGMLKAGMDPTDRIVAERLLARPELRMTWDHRSDPPHVRARIAMGGHRFVPEQGFDARGELVISRDEGKVRTRKLLRLEPDSSGTDFVHELPRDLQKGTPYRAELTVDLSPFFGVIKARDETVAR